MATSKPIMAKTAEPRTAMASITVELEEGTPLAEFNDWRVWADIYALTLEDPSCPEAFREAFDCIVFEQLYPAARLGMAEPTVLRALFPVACALADHRGASGTAEGIRGALRSLFDSLVPTELRERARARATADSRARRIASQLAELVSDPQTDRGTRGEIAEAFVGLSEKTGINTDTHPELVERVFLVMHRAATSDGARENVEDLARLAGFG